MFLAHSQMCIAVSWYYKLHHQQIQEFVEVEVGQKNNEETVQADSLVLHNLAQEGVYVIQEYD